MLVSSHLHLEVIILFIWPVGHHHLTQAGLQTPGWFTEASLGGVTAFEYRVSGLGQLPGRHGLQPGGRRGGGARPQGGGGADVPRGVLLLLPQLKYPELSMVTDRVGSIKKFRPQY